MPMLPTWDQRGFMVSRNETTLYPARNPHTSCPFVSTVCLLQSSNGQPSVKHFAQVPMPLRRTNCQYQRQTEEPGGFHTCTYPCPAHELTLCDVLEVKHFLSLYRGVQLLWEVYIALYLIQISLYVCAEVHNCARGCVRSCGNVWLLSL